MDNIVITEQEKRDRLTAEWILRIAALEKALISKGVVTEQEVNDSLKEAISRLSEFMSAFDELKKK